MVVPWFGPLPSWMACYRQRVAAQKIDWLYFHDLDDFKRRVKRVLGIECPIKPGSAKIHDFRPAFGVLFEKELQGYDWWGHTDLDCVYGKLDRFYGPRQLEGLDIASDNTDYIAGPWTLYRNTPDIAGLFWEHPDALRLMKHRRTTGWIETRFTEMLETTGLRVRYRLQHAYGDPQHLALKRTRLLHFGVEVPFFHFRRTKEWPL